MFINIYHINMANLSIIYLQENSWKKFTPHLAMSLMIHPTRKQEDLRLQLQIDESLLMFQSCSKDKRQEN